MTSQMAEPCDACGVVRHHEIHIELVNETVSPDAQAYAREPYRVATCLDCGATTQTRMNGA